MANGRIPSPSAELRQRVVFMGRNMVGFVTFDLILGGIPRGPMAVSFVVEITHVDLDDPTVHPASFGIPTDVVSHQIFSHRGLLTNE